MRPTAKEEGSRIHFRAICGVGWVLFNHLTELHDICDGQAQGREYLEWIDLISQELESYEPTHDSPDVWIADMQGKLTTLANGPAGRGEPAVQSLLLKISSELSHPIAGDIQFQLERFNTEGHRTAGEMLTDKQWSTVPVAKRWGTIPVFSVLIDPEEGANTFYPVTVKREQQIRLKVEPTSFKPAFGLLSYLTLGFQFMHEYVSHALPLWVNGSQEEVLLLAATYRFYPLSLPWDGIRSFLADTLRVRRGDEYSTARNRVMNFAAQMGQERFSRFVLTLAITDDEALSKAAKGNLASKLKSLPLSDGSLQVACNQYLMATDPGPAEFAALRELIPSKQ